MGALKWTQKLLCRCRFLWRHWKNTKLQCRCRSEAYLYEVPRFKVMVCWIVDMLSDSQSRSGLWNPARDFRLGNRLGERQTWTLFWLIKLRKKLTMCWPTRLVQKISWRSTENRVNERNWTAKNLRRLDHARIVDWLDTNKLNLSNQIHNIDFLRNFSNN